MIRSTPPTIVWLRDDLRVSDNPALVAAVDRGAPVVVVYLLDDESPQVRPLGAATRWWLHSSLDALGSSISSLGGSLVLRSGAAAEAIPQLIAETGADAIYWNRRYGAAREIDAGLKSSLREQGLDVQSFQANLLFEPWTVTTGEGNPYRVFTPFWRACLERGVSRSPLPAPASIQGVDVAGDSLADWQLLPTRPDWSGGLRETWVPGEAAAHDRLDTFIDGILDDYHRRDEPGIESTSGLSPHLRFGEISPFQVYDAVRKSRHSPPVLRWVRAAVNARLRARGRPARTG